LPILLADEPTGSLDTQTADSIFGLFGELNTTGLTVFVVTHNDQLAATNIRRFDCAMFIQSD